MKFFTGIIIIALLGYIYIARRLRLPLLHWALLFIPFSFLIAFPFFRDNYVIANLAFAAMGFLTYMFVLTVFRDLLKLFKLRSVTPLMVVIAAALCTGAGTLKAIYGIRTVTTKIVVKKLPSELTGFRIVHISDLHIGPTIGASFVRRVVERVNALSPDLIVFTGDIGDAAVSRHHEDAAPLAELKSTYGSFYVPGNHEVYWKAGEWGDKFRSLGMKVIVNTGEVITHKGKSILVSGVPDPRSGIDWHPEIPLSQNRTADYKILLSHRPEIAEHDLSKGYDLICAGHTHGGQFFPWTIVAWLDHKYFVGLYEEEGRHIYVSPGTGSWGPLLRLGSTPEIAVLELSK